MKLWRMENMFKKSLLAAALSAVAFNAAAATTAPTSGNLGIYGKEYLQNETTIDVPSVTVTLGAQYSQGDIIKLTISGATVSTTASSAAAAFAAGGSGATMTLGLLDLSGNTATFRVTAASGDHSSGGGATVAFTGLKITGASGQSASTVSAVYSAETSTGIAIDSASTNTGKVMKFVDQYVAKFNASTDKFDEVISTGDLRKKFTSTPGLADNIAARVSEYATVAGEAWVEQGGAPSSVKIKVNGDWSFLDTNNDGKIDGSDAISAPFTSGVGTVAVATDLQSFTTTATAPAVNTDYTTTATVATAAGATTIKDQAFTADVTHVIAAKTGGNVSETATLAAGEWKLDGKKFTVPYLPYGDNTAVIFRITNLGSISGNVSARYLNEKTSTWVDLGVIGTSNAGQVQDFRDALVNAIKASSGDSAGKVAVEVTVNAPTANIKGYAAYKVVSETDRGFVGTF